MSIVSDIRWAKVGAVPVVVCMLFVLHGCLEGPGEKQSPKKTIKYRLNIIIGKATQRFADGSVYGGLSLSAEYDNWDLYTKQGGIVDNYSPDACQGFLDSLETPLVEDTTTYKISSPNLNGAINYVYVDPYGEHIGFAQDLQTFAVMVKENAIERDEISGKCALIISAAQYDGSAQNNVKEPHWDYLPEFVRYGDYWPMHDTTGTVMRCGYNNKYPTGIVFTLTASIVHTYLEEKITSLGAYDETSWANDPPGKYSYTKFVHSTFAHELGHELGCYNHHFNSDEDTICCMRGNLKAPTALNSFTWEAQLRTRVFAICYCPNCAGQFCSKTIFKE